MKCDAATVCHPCVGNAYKSLLWNGPRQTCTTFSVSSVNKNKDLRESVKIVLEKVVLCICRCKTAFTADTCCFNGHSYENLNLVGLSNLSMKKGHFKFWLPYIIIIPFLLVSLSSFMFPLLFLVFYSLCPANLSSCSRKSFWRNSGYYLNGGWWYYN